MTTTRQIGWLSRPSGGRMFMPGKVHDYDASIDLAAAATLRTECGTEVPQPVLRELRGVTTTGAFLGSAVLMDAAEIASGEPCKRCSKKATGGTR